MNSGIAITLTIAATSRIGAVQVLTNSSGRFQREQHTMFSRAELICAALRVATVAQARARLQMAAPAADTTLAQAPTEIRMRFTKR